jgi:hypothetical protein
MVRRWVTACQQGGAGSLPPSAALALVTATRDARDAVSVLLIEVTLRPCLNYAGPRCEFRLRLVGSPTAGEAIEDWAEKFGITDEEQKSRLAARPVK